MEERIPRKLLKRLYAYIIKLADNYGTSEEEVVEEMFNVSSKEAQEIWNDYINKD